MITHDMLLTFKTLELLTKGADLNSFQTESDIKNSYFNKENKLISRLSENVEDFYFILDDELRTYLYLDHPIFKRQGKIFYSVIEECIPQDAAVLKGVTKEIFMSAVQQIYLKGLCKYSDITISEKDPEFISRNIALDKNYDPSAYPTDMVKNLSRDKTDFFLKVLLATCYWATPQLMRSLYEFDKGLKNWDVLKAKYPDANIIDDRMYIPVKPSTRRLSTENKDVFDNCDYIVISKNVYDYFFCSYGSAHQSCYSLNSPHKGFYGMIPMILSDNHYIVYGTKSHAQKVTIGGNNSKFPAPYMFFRAWGWMSEDDCLLIDKIYTTFSTTDVDNFLNSNNIPVTNIGFHALKDGQKYEQIYDTYGCRFYPDSLRDNLTRFCRGNGVRSFIGNRALNFLVPAQSVTSALNQYTVSPSLDLYKDIDCVEGVLLNPKKCPITNLVIPDSDDVHWLANVIKKPCENLLVIDWVDGLFKMLTSTTNSEDMKRTLHFILDYNTGTTSKDFSSFGDANIYLTNFYSLDKISLNKLKAYIQNYKSELDYDMIILRVVNKNDINFIKYINKKG